MRTYLVTNYGGKRAVLLWSNDLTTEPKTVTAWAILDAEAPDRDYRVDLRNWRIEGNVVVLDTPDEGDIHARLQMEEVPIQRPRGRGWRWDNGRWAR